MTVSSWPGSVDIFPGSPYQDNVEYLDAAYANAWVAAILALEAGIGTGTGTSSPLYSAAYSTLFPTLAARISALEDVVTQVPSIDHSVGDIAPVAAAPSPGATNRSADAGHVHVGVTSWNGRQGAVVPETGDYTAPQVTNAANLMSSQQQQFLSNVASPASVALGLNTLAPARFVGSTVSGPPTTGAFDLADFVVDQTGTTWVCIQAGSPGEWVGRPAVTPSARMYAAQTTVLDVVETNYQINLAPDFAQGGFTFGNNSIVFPVSGTYFIGWKVTFQLSNTPYGQVPTYGSYFGYAAINDNFIRASIDFSTGTDAGPIPGPGGFDVVGNVEAGQSLQLWGAFTVAAPPQQVDATSYNTWLSATLVI